MAGPDARVSNRLGLSLPEMHRATAVKAERQALAEDVDELRERLIKKLLRLKKRVTR